MSCYFRYTDAERGVTCTTYRRRQRIDVNAPTGALGAIALLLVTGAIVAMCVGGLPW